MTNFEKFVLSALPLVPKVVDAIVRWADGDNDSGTPIDEEVRRILGPAESRLDRAIAAAKERSP